MQGPSSNNQFWAEFAKPAGEYIDSFAEAAQGLDPQQSLIMDNSASTFAFYWSAGELVACAGALSSCASVDAT